MISARILQATFNELDQWRDNNIDQKSDASASHKMKMTENLISFIDDQRSLLNSKKQKDFLQAISDHIDKPNYYPMSKTYRWGFIPLNSEAPEYSRLKQAITTRMNAPLMRSQRITNKRTTTSLINKTMNISTSIKLFTLAWIQVSADYINIFFTYEGNTYSANIIGGDNPKPQGDFIQSMINNGSCGIAPGSYLLLGNQFESRACGYPKNGRLSPNYGEVAFYSLNKNTSLPVLSCLIDMLEKVYCPQKELPPPPYGIIIGSVVSGLIIVGGAYFYCTRRQNHRPPTQAAVAEAQPAIPLDEQKEPGTRVFNESYEKLNEQANYVLKELQTGSCKNHLEQPTALVEAQKIVAGLNKFKEDCICSVCTNILENPTTLISQKTYDIACIRTWLQTKTTDPLTRENISYHQNRALPINTDKKNQIENRLKEIEKEIEKIYKKLDLSLPQSDIRVSVTM